MSKKAWRLDTKGKFAGTKSCTKYVAIWEVPANQTFVPASSTVCRLKYQSTFPNSFTFALSDHSPRHFFFCSTFTCTLHTPDKKLTPQNSYFYFWLSAVYYTVSVVVWCCFEIVVLGFLPSCFGRRIPAYIPFASK